MPLLLASQLDNLEDEELLDHLVRGFAQPDLFDDPYELDDDDAGEEPRLDFWNSDYFWQDAQTADAMTSTASEQRIAEETVKATTPGSSANFQAAQGATMPRQMTTGDFAQEMLRREGAEYEWGGTSRKTGFDCSGIINRIMRNRGFPNFPRTSGEIYAHSKKVSLKKAINTRGAILWKEGHIAVSLGNGKTIEAMGEEYGVVVGDAKGRFTGGGILPELKLGKGLHEALRKTRRQQFQQGAPRRQKLKAGGVDLVEAPAAITRAATVTEGFRSALEDLDEEMYGTPKRLKDKGWDDASLSEIQEMAWRMFKRRGLSRDEFVAARRLWARESGDEELLTWNPDAFNEDSGTSGIPQRHPDHGPLPDNWDNPRVQIRWGIDYVLGRYGSFEAALRHSDEEGWY